MTHNFPAAPIFSHRVKEENIRSCHGYLVSLQRSATITVIDEFVRNMRTTNALHPRGRTGEERSCSRFPIEMLTGSLPSCTYKDGVDELWRTGENRERDLFSWWKKVVPVTSDRVCVSLWKAGSVVKGKYGDLDVGL